MEPNQCPSLSLHSRKSYNVQYIYEMTVWFGLLFSFILNTRLQILCKNSMKTQRKYNFNSVIIAYELIFKSIRVIVTYTSIAPYSSKPLQFQPIIGFYKNHSYYSTQDIINSFWRSLKFKIFHMNIKMHHQHMDVHVRLMI